MGNYHIRDRLDVFYTPDAHAVGQEIMAINLAQPLLARSVEGYQPTPISPMNTGKRYIEKSRASYFRYFFCSIYVCIQQ